MSNGELKTSLDQAPESKCKNGGEPLRIVDSQLPVDKGNVHIGEPMPADAIVEPLVHNAQHLKVRGDSLRRNRATLTEQNSDN